MPPRVLTVARWYPAHDSPGSGSFVADLVAATRDAGAEHVVASFETIRATRHLPDAERRRADAVAAYASRADPAVLLRFPSTRGVPGVAVARLPVVPFPGEPDASGLVTAHEQALEPFVARLLPDWRPDVIHAHTGLPDGVAAARLGRRLGLPVVVSEHASTIEEILAEPAARDRYRELLQPPVTLVAVSPALRSRLANALGIDEAPIGVLPNPIDIPAFDIAGDHDHPDADREPDLLLWVGSRAEHKGIETLLRAVALTRAVRPAARLRMIGRARLPDEDARWASLAGELGLADAVTLEPWADRATVARAMRQAAVFVHPSPAETFGVVAAEAIASGLPVAARASGGVSWVIETSGGFGAVARDGSPAALADAIVRLLAGPPSTDAPRARERIRAAFGAAAVARAALALYPAADPGAPAGNVPRTSTGPLPAIAVGMERAPALRATAALSAALRQTLTVVTAAGDEPGGAGEGARRLVEVDLDAAHRAALAHLDPTGARAGLAGLAGLPGRALARVRGQSRARERAELVAARPEARLQALAAAVRDVASHAPTPPPVAMVALDLGAAAAILDTAGAATLAPAGLRWLADAWDEDRGAAR